MGILAGALLGHPPRLRPPLEHLAILAEQVGDQVEGQVAQHIGQVLAVEILPRRRQPGMRYCRVLQSPEGGA